MKPNIIAIVFILFTRLTFAQQDILSYDEHNKYIYYQLVDMPGSSTDTLQARGLHFLKTLFPRIKLKEELNGKSVNGEGKFLVYSGVSGIRHEGGEIAYLVTIEFKDQKYRFWLTGFTFTPYERDKNDNYIPKPGIEIPLESASLKLEKKELDNYLNETGAFCKQFGERLKIYMLNTPKKEENLKKIAPGKR